MLKRMSPLFLASMAALGLASCQTQHTHAYDLENPVWEWSQFSSATLTFTCTGCADSAEGHTYVVDADITLKESVSATCEKAGYKVYEAKATFQEHTYTDSKTQPIPASGHSEDKSAWRYDETKHWHPCLYCGDSYHYEEAEHTMTDWTETLAPTYHEEGNKERHCTVCSYTENEAVDKLRYTYEQVSAFEKVFSAFPSDSPYLGKSLDSLIDSIENMDEDEKAAHSEEIAEWRETASKTKTTYDRYYKTLIDTEGLDNYEKTKTSAAFDSAYGDVLKVNADGELVTRECWAYGADRKASLVKEGISAVRLAIYAPQAMNVSFINSKCNLWYDASSGKVVSKQSETTMSAGAWKEFTVPTSAIGEMDDFKIALYLSPSPYIGYGIPTLADSESKGSAYVSEIIGVKDAYYDDQAEALAAEFDEAVAKISSVSTPTKADAYYVYEANEIYESLSEAAKALCTRVDDFNSAKANCAYLLVSPMAASSCAYTDWTGTASAEDIFDESVGKAMKITITTTGGAIESPIASLAVDSSAYDTVSFSIKSDWNAQFCFSKSDWWTNAYDFSTNGWVANGGVTAYRSDSSTGWAELTMSLSDFNECKYFSFLNNVSVGQSFYISAIYAYKAA